MPKVLIVEDDEAMAVALRDGFEFEGYNVLLARDGFSGMKLATQGGQDLLLLDVMLPRVSGVDICKRVRSTGSRVPIIMLTARGQEIDKVMGLKSGADDYVTKPFSFMELMARVEAVLRRAGKEGSGLDKVKFGDVELSLKKGEVKKGGKPVELTSLEFRLLKYFIEHEDVIISRDELLTAVWGVDSGALTRTVDMHVAKLRKKIESRPADPRYLTTVHGMGYKFQK